MSEESWSELVPLLVEHLRWEQEMGGIGLPLVETSKSRAKPTALEVTPQQSANTTEPNRSRRLLELAAEVSTCTRCELHRTRTNTVFARGNPSASLAFVGEGPGYNEDQQGLPFVGAAGQLLDKMIAAMGLSRDDVYICNVVKCRPPENRTPLPPETAACFPFLKQQLQLVAPQVVVALGRCAATNLGAPDGTGWRGRFWQWEGISVLATYHPAYLLRNPEQKRPVWDDLKQVMARLGLPSPRRE